MKTCLIICSKTSSNTWHKNTKVSKPANAITMNYQKSLHKIQIYIKKCFGCITKAHKRQSHWTTTYKGLLVWFFKMNCNRKAIVPHAVGLHVTDWLGVEELHILSGWHKSSLLEDWELENHCYSAKNKHMVKIKWICIGICLYEPLPNSPFYIPWGYFLKSSKWWEGLDTTPSVWTV